jgi:flagellar capping protein FliD
MKGLTDSLSSPIQNALSGLNSTMSSLQKSIDAYELRLQAREDYLYAMYSAADEALRLYQVTMSSLTNQLASLSSNTST